MSEMVYACPRCGDEFPTPEKCRAHIRDCQEGIRGRTDDDDFAEDDEIIEVETEDDDEEEIYDERVQKWAA